MTYRGQVQPDHETGSRLWDSLGLPLLKANSMKPVTEASMAAFDYNTVAKLFPTGSKSDLLPVKSRRYRRHPVGYGRFARASDAIRFAIEELPPELLLDTCLEVDGKRFDLDGIRRLCESVEYPLARRATIP